MNRRIFISLLVIAMAIAAMTGATLAWFTAEDTTVNTFTAGTLIINADDEWTNYAEGNWVNANPGDCEPKEFSITNEGNKNMYVRFTFTGGWVTPLPNPQEITPVPDPLNDDLVTVNPAAGFTDDWTYLDDGYWYYNGVLPPNDGTTNNHILTFTLNVCLNGPNTGNVYQGASYNLTFNFDAIQVTHTASFMQWDAGFYNATANPAWYEVVLEGTDYKFVGNNPSAIPWAPTGSGEPNWEGWTY